MKRSQADSLDIAVSMPCDCDEVIDPRVQAELRLVEVACAQDEVRARERRDAEEARRSRN